MFFLGDLNFRIKDISRNDVLQRVSGKFLLTLKLSGFEILNDETFIIHTNFGFILGFLKTSFIIEILFQNIDIFLIFSRS